MPMNKNNIFMYTMIEMNRLLQFMHISDYEYGYISHIFFI